MASASVSVPGQSTPPRSIGVAYLTLAPLPAPESVSVAAEAGFDFVGLRVKPFSASDPDLGMGSGSKLLRETRMRLDDTGLSVLDIEFVLLTETIGEPDWLPVLESGAELGASLVSVAAADSNFARVSDNLTALTETAAKYGMRPALEPISYQRLHTLSEAVDIASESGAAVLLDPLHLARAGDDVSAVADVDSTLIPVVQLCDAPSVSPGTQDALARESRFGRLPPGAGQLHLVEFLKAAPPEAPISVEVPNATLRAGMSDVDFARMNLLASRDLLERIAAERGNNLD